MRMSIIYGLARLGERGQAWDSARYFVILAISFGTILLLLGAEALLANGWASLVGPVIGYG